MRPAVEDLDHVPGEAELETPDLLRLEAAGGPTHSEADAGQYTETVIAHPVRSQAGPAPAPGGASRARATGQDRVSTVRVPPGW
jgi:hypothetical protein